jgi:hypothetical protein
MTFQKLYARMRRAYNALCAAGKPSEAKMVEDLWMCWWIRRCIVARAE